MSSLIPVAMQSCAVHVHSEQKSAQLARYRIIPYTLDFNVYFYFIYTGTGILNHEGEGRGGEGTVQHQGACSPRDLNAPSSFKKKNMTSILVNI